MSRARARYARRVRATRLLALALALAPGAAARADVLPPPEAPNQWQPRDPPQPAPPPEKELPPLALWLVAVAAFCAVAVGRRPVQEAR